MGPWDGASGPVTAAESDFGARDSQIADPRDVEGARVGAVDGDSTAGALSASPSSSVMTSSGTDVEPLREERVTGIESAAVNARRVVTLGRGGVAPGVVASGSGARGPVSWVAGGVGAFGLAARPPEDGEAGVRAANGIGCGAVDEETRGSAGGGGVASTEPFGG